MKNFKLQPFEKNNYFYGKLLTVRDFQIEQKYNNEKRWMMNRLMFGNGIATGLNVVMIDEQIITVEAGIAVDNLGREIVVASPITQKLSLIDGFDNSGYSKSVYLCIDYEEKGKERIQTITNTVDEQNDDALSYNRIQENYKIFLKENISEEDMNKNNTSYLSRICIYENNKVQICQSVPKYVEPNEEFEISVDIIKKDSSCSVDLTYTINSDNAFCADDMGTKDVVVKFNESSGNIKSSYTLKYKMRSDSRTEKNSAMFITINSLKINDKKVTQTDDLFVEFSIVDDKIEALFKSYNNRSMESIVNDESYETIYLAKINLLKVGSVYLIKSITNCPFNQYIYSNNIIIDLLKQRVNNANKLLSLDTDSNDIEQSEYDGQALQKNDSAKDISEKNIMMQDMSMAEGEYIFKLDDKIKYPYTLYSETIEHGLGDGEVMLNISIYEEENFEDVLYSGDIDIFDRCNCKAATILNPKKGSFVIAIRAMDKFRYDQIRIKWYAIKKQKVK